MDEKEIVLKKNFEVKFSHEQVFSYRKVQVLSLLYFEKQHLLLVGDHFKLQKLDIETCVITTIYNKGADFLMKWDKNVYLSLSKKIHSHDLNDENQTFEIYESSGYSDRVYKLTRISQDEFAGLTSKTAVFLFSYSQKSIIRRVNGNLVGPGYAYYTRIISSIKHPGCVFVNPDRCSNKLHVIKMIDTSETNDPIIKHFEATDGSEASSITMTELRNYVDNSKNEVLVASSIDSFNQVEYLWFYHVSSSKCIRKIPLPHEIQVRAMKLLKNGNNVFITFGCIRKTSFHCYWVGGDNDKVFDVFNIQDFAEDGIRDFSVISKSKGKREMKICSISYDKKVRITKLIELPVQMFLEEKGGFEVQDLRERLEFLRSISSGVFSQNGVLKYRPFLKIKINDFEIDFVYKTIVL